jgi:hypothetical protein
MQKLVQCSCVAAFVKIKRSEANQVHSVVIGETLNINVSQLYSRKTSRGAIGKPVKIQAKRPYATKTPRVPPIIRRCAATGVKVSKVTIGFIQTQPDKNVIVEATTAMAIFSCFNDWYGYITLSP